MLSVAAEAVAAKKLKMTGIVEPRRRAAIADDL
jgi:hypothetical protein